MLGNVQGVVVHASTEALSSTETGPNHAIQNHSTQIPNVISLANNLTIAHSATSSKSNSLGLISNLHSDDQSSIAQECQNTILINHATQRPQLSSPYERSSTIDAPQPANTFISSSTFSSLDVSSQNYDWAGEDIDLTDDGGAIIAVDNGRFGFLKISNVQNLLNGDLNNDNTLNVLDVVLMVNIILDDSTYLPDADLNLDGAINVLDVVALVNLILSSEN